jgi:peptidoglycan/LPS O-acetylase OafA/YrhL
MTLDEVLARPGNNLTFVRFFAAAMVLLSHSFITNKLVQDEPLSRLTSGVVDCATLGVTFFFAISGLLVTKSYCERGQLKYFLLSRCLRILPGYGVALLLTACVFGAIVTTLPLAEYFSAKETWRYVYTQFAMRSDATLVLPGVFSSLPLAGMVNASLWTIRVEFMLYLVTAFLGWMALLQSRAAFNAIALIMLVASVTIESIPVPGWSRFAWLYAGVFLFGAFLYVNRRHVPLTPWIAILFVATAYFTAGKPAGRWWLLIAISYGAIMVSLWAPNVFGKLKNDYSYGTYLYAFPIQQMLIDRWGLWNPWVHALVSLLVTFVFAWMSWHYVEHPVLRFKAKSGKDRDEGNNPKTTSVSIQ